MRRAGIILIVAAAAALVASAIAAAHTKVYFNTLSIRTATEAGNFHFKGNVGSSKPACRAGRRVTVYLKTPAGPEKTGAATTTADGKWDLDTGGGLIAVGSYYAQMGRKVLRHGGGHYHACAAVKTPPLKIAA